MGSMAGRIEQMEGACPWPALPPPRKVPLVVCPEHPCPYLPGRMAMTRAFASSNIPPELYHQFMDAGFRRSGEIVYQPVCRGCRACMPIRVPVATFRASKSQRRSRKRNSDLTVTVGKPMASDEKWELYRRYTLARHGPKEEDRGAFEQFLYE
jgi:arginyl-tRNA--protein-N-Asp/Glu arginylyltransferase